jgi:hypothetical protein
MRKKHIEHTIKKSKATVIRHLATKMLKRNTTLKGRVRLNVKQISCGRNIFAPKVRWDGGSNHKSMSCLKNMTMLTLSNPILSLSTRIRKLGRSTLLCKYLAKSLKEILSCRIHMKNTNRSCKMSVNHNRESLIDG